MNVFMLMMFLFNHTMGVILQDAVLKGAKQLILLPGDMLGAKRVGVILRSWAPCSVLLGVVFQGAELLLLVLCVPCS